MKKIIYQILVFLSFLAISLPAYATTPSSIRELRQDLKNQIQEQRKEFKEERKSLMDNFLDLKNQLQEKIRSLAAKIIGGEITAISGTTLTVTKGGKTYTVNADGNTKFRRHFWGKSDLNEFSVGNKVNIFGKFTDENKTSILARLIRNLSIMKRRGIFFGDVTVKNSTDFKIKSVNRGEQSVFFDSSTKFENRKGEIVSFGDVKVGDRVRVHGLWDKSLNKITEVVEVKDFSLPLKTTPTPTP